MLAAACAPAEDSTSGDAGAWVGTITTEGKVITVVNQSGSVWGTGVELVEALSIGGSTRRRRRLPWPYRTR